MINFVSFVPTTLSRLFLTEGIFTIFTGVIAFVVMPDRTVHIQALNDHPPCLTSYAAPFGASWLTENEKAFIHAMLPGNSPRSAEANFKFCEILNVLKYNKSWLFTLY
jgi:hypothetical protein